MASRIILSGIHIPRRFLHSFSPMTMSRHLHTMHVLPSREVEASWRPAGSKADGSAVPRRTLAQAPAPCCSEGPHSPYRRQPPVSGRRPQPGLLGGVGTWGSGATLEHRRPRCADRLTDAELTVFLTGVNHEHPFENTASVRDTP